MRDQIPKLRESIKEASMTDLKARLTLQTLLNNSYWCQHWTSAWILWEWVIIICSLKQAKKKTKKHRNKKKYNAHTKKLLSTILVSDGNAQNPSCVCLPRTGFHKIKKFKWEEKSNANSKQIQIHWKKQNWIPSAILTETEVPGVTSVCTCLPQIPPQLVQTQMQRGDMNKCNTNKKKHISNVVIGPNHPLVFGRGWQQIQKSTQVKAELI